MIITSIAMLLCMAGQMFAYHLGVRDGRNHERQIAARLVAAALSSRIGPPDAPTTSQPENP